MSLDEVREEIAEDFRRYKCGTCGSEVTIVVKDEKILWQCNNKSCNFYNFSYLEFSGEVNWALIPHGLVPSLGTRM